MRAKSTMRSASPGSQSGVMLIEALVAILLFTLGIIAVMGLQANSILQVGQAKYRTDASYLANQIISDMWVDQGNIPNYLTAGSTQRAPWDNQVARTLPAGTATITQAGTLITVTVNWKAPEDVVTHKYVAIANINAS